MIFEKRGGLQMCADVNIVNIDNYIRSDKEHKYPICREERQYALYLSNVLRYYGKNPNYNNSKGEPINRIGHNEIVKKIFRACGFNKKNDFDNLDNLIIENVYYEATFMRDFFERNRQTNFKKDDAEITEENKKFSFNRRLLEYCWIHFLQQDSIAKLEGLIAEKIKNGEMKENNYGAQNEIPFLEYVEHVKKDFKNEEEFKKEFDNIEIKNKEEFLRSIKLRKIVRSMMNAKPDLAVLYYDYKKKGVRKLFFIECKYKSKEDNYIFYSIDANEKIKKDKISQRAVQGYIAEFLCNSYLKDVEKSEIMKNDNNESRMIKFVADSVKDEEGQTKEGKIYGKINIKDLIKIEEDIFNK